ncbi:site-specific integrase [Granulicella sp. L60]|uniref:tyrosine-type recombinase/integrase n=1 Tax=Granulicella sp. L60 TaxID=1641866 RepID=UPI00131C1801|nr:site-specific integrase [Granulicella sp. L60]
MAEGQHLGYRKASEGCGRWIARYYIKDGEKKAYRFETLGSADDTVPADDAEILSYSQAVFHANKWFNGVDRDLAAGVRRGAYTVQDAADDWIAAWKSSEASKRNSLSNLKHHILPELGNREVAKLTRHEIQKWLGKVADKKPIRAQQHEEIRKKLAPSRRSSIVYDPNDPETKRKRRDTANRIFNDLSALLTLAYRNQRVASKAAWETVDKFENVDLAKNEYLTLKEANRFIKVCPVDFRDLVQGALITGCRYGELTRLKVSSYDVQLRAISLVQPKTSKVKHIFLTDEESSFFDRRIENKGGGDLMFKRDYGEPWAKSNQQGRMKAVLKSAGIRRHVRFHDLRHTFGTLLAMNGTSMQLIANQLGHSGTRIAEKHYAHFSPSYVATTIRANKPSFGFEKIKPHQSQ